MHRKDELTKSIQSLQQSVDKSNSLKWTFLMGIIRGVGAVIGATILAGLLLSWAAATFDTISQVPLIGQYFSGVSETLESSTQSISPAPNQ